MSFLRRVRRGSPAGSRILSRKQEEKNALMNWPKCALCNRSVDAYGLENDTPRAIEIWARCDGIEIDPGSGLQVHGGVRVHPQMKSSVTIEKKAGWSPNRLTDIVARLAFFAPDEGRHFEQDTSADGVTAKS